jgi:hypothetical protein
MRRVLTPTIGAIGHTCLVLSSWAKPPALANAWCLLETLTSLAAGAKLTVQVAPDEGPLFAQALARRPETVRDAVLHWGLNLNEAFGVSQSVKQLYASSASSVSPQTKRHAKSVLQMKAETDVDARITSQMRAWACAQALRALGQIPKQARAVSALQQELAGMLLEQGRYAGAEQLLREAAEARRLQFGPDSPLTAKTDEMHARLMRMQGRLDEAESSLTSVLGRRQVLLHDAANDDDVSNDEAATMATALVQEELALVYQAFLIVELTSPHLTYNQALSSPHHT